MTTVALKNVSVCYMTGDLRNIGLKEWVLRRMTGQYTVHTFWANRNISFSLQKGDMLGIIGTNGAGKSTLLKTISGVMKPTEGEIRVRGTVAALIELASGFDEDLTVRENAYLRGAFLGYTRKFMDEHYDSILAFAELETFQDYTFRQLSSGMKSRLAFSIASELAPDIMILDEVLSVGDGAFKEKSHQKMTGILKQGITGLLVSHSLEQVRELCNKALWLDHGEQIAFGPADEVCERYESFLRSRSFDYADALERENGD